MDDDCGCNAGAVGSILVLGAYLTVSGLWPLLARRPSWTSWIGAVGAVVVGGVAGKIIGLARARARPQRATHGG